MSDNTNVNRMSGKSKDVWQEKLEAIKKTLPEIISDNQVDWEKLQRLIGEENIAAGERYNFSWAGKSNAIQEIKKRTTATLKPDYDESEDFENTENIFIEGENLEVLRVLQKSYYGKVKMIYIDPPYNTGNDFVYNDKFAETREEYEEKTGDVDEEGKKIRALQKNTKESGHYHSNWLNMMYPRLYLARNLLREDGVIFVSIDDNEVHNLRMIMNEIFGEENSLTTLIWQKKLRPSNKNEKGYSSTTEYILCYVKSTNDFELRDDPLDKDYVDRTYRNPDNDSKGSWRTKPLYSESNNNPRKTLELHDGRKLTQKWFVSQETLNKYYNEGRIRESKSGTLEAKVYLSEIGGKDPINFLSGKKYGTTESATKNLKKLFEDKRVYSYPKPVPLLKKLVFNSTNQESIILDFFAGSATTAHAVMELNKEDGGNRKYIMVQMPEETDEDSGAYKAGYKNIADIAKERIRRAAKKIKKENEEKLDFEGNDLDLGFKVFKLSDSNFKTWRREVIDSEKDLQQKLQDYVENLKSNVKKKDMLYELILKLGINPNTDIQDRDDYYLVENGEYVICLEKAINKEIAQNILEEKPSVVVCLDVSFEGNDELKTNTALQMKAKNIEFKVV